MFKHIIIVLSSLTLFSCQTTTSVSGCQNSVALGFGVFQVSDLKCTYDSDMTRGTSTATSIAKNDDYNSSNKVQTIVHPNMYYNTRAIKGWDFKAGFYFIKLKDHCFSAELQNDQVITYYSVCKNSYQSFNQNEIRKLMEEKYNFSSYKSNSQRSKSASSNSNYANCKSLGFKEGSTSFKKCLSNFAK